MMTQEMAVLASQTFYLVVFVLALLTSQSVVNRSHSWLYRFLSSR